MTLTLVSAEYGYNVYENGDGDEIIGTPLPVLVELTMWDDVDLHAAWLAAIAAHRALPHNGWYSNPNHVKWEAELRREVADEDAVEIVWCENCSAPIKGDEATAVDGDGWACQSCYESDYRSCDDCGTIVHYDRTHSTLSDEAVCTRCCDNSYSYCDECDGYYHDSSSEYHQHGGCDCAPPSTAVRMRNGDEVLTENERITVSLPAGVISDEGINSIATLVRGHAYSMTDTAAGELITEAMWELRNKWWNLSYEVPMMDARWQTKEGNFTKRLSKLAHKSQGLKFPPDLLTKVGNIARDNSQGSEIAVELTRDLNQSAEAFYHEDSCWWQSYSESRCSLKNNGGIGMRTFAGPYNEVTGRAWVMPLRQTETGRLVPTFDSLAANAYMVFNGYGDLSGYTPARVVAGMAGMTYRKISFDCSPMYVNGETGYLVSSEEICAKYATDGRLSIDADTHSNLYYREQSARLAAEVAEQARQLVNA